MIIKKSILSIGVLSLGLVFSVNSHARLRVRTNVNVTTTAGSIKTMPGATSLAGAPRASLNRFITKAEGLSQSDQTAAMTSPTMSSVVSLIEGFITDENETGASGLNRDESIKLLSDIGYSLMSSLNVAEDKKLDNLANLLVTIIHRGSDSNALALPDAEDPDGRRLDAADIQKFVVFFAGHAEAMAEGSNHDQALETAHGQKMTVGDKEVDLFADSLAEVLRLCSLELNNSNLSD